VFHQRRIGLDIFEQRRNSAGVTDQRQRSDRFSFGLGRLLLQDFQQPGNRLAA